MHKQYSEEGTRFVELSYEVRYLVKIIKRLSTTKKKKKLKNISVALPKMQIYINLQD